MKSIFDFIIEPKKNRYNNTTKVGDKDLILNTEIFNHQYVSREAVIKHLPLAIDTDLKVGDEIIVHHNVFRRWHDIRGKEKNSRSFLDENTYCVKQDQIYSYNRNKCGWKTLNGFCFVKPIKSNDNFTTEKEKSLVGIMKYMDPLLKKYNISEGDLVGFTPNSEWEFVIDDQIMYCMKSNDIVIKYELDRNEEEYNSRWAQGN